VAAAVAGERDRQRGASGRDVLRRGARRAGEVLVWAVLFRVWMLASGSFGRPADLLRVDVLNCIGVSLLLLAVALAAPTAPARVAAALGLAVAVAALTPPAWDSPAVKVLPAPLRYYVSGREADAMFPIFPWATFAAVGAVVGVLLAEARARRREGRVITLAAAAGAAVIPGALYADRHLPAVYEAYDFWYTSPSYTALKAGVALVVLAAACLLDKLPGPSALRQLGRTSLLVYWVHLEIVYGQWVVPSVHGRLSVDEAQRGVIALALAMLALSLVRTRAGQWWSARPSRTAATA
jgi:uncharacterized membrane protein